MKKILSFFLFFLISALMLPLDDALALTTYTTSFSVSDQTTQPDDIAFNSDGTKMFILGGYFIYEYSLSTGFIQLNRGPISVIRRYLSILPPIYLGFH